MSTKENSYNFDFYYESLNFFNSENLELRRGKSSYNLLLRSSELITPRKILESKNNLNDIITHVFKYSFNRNEGHVYAALTPLIHTSDNMRPVPIVHLYFDEDEFQYRGIGTLVNENSVLEIKKFELSSKEILLNPEEVFANSLLVKNFPTDYFLATLSKK